MLYSLTLTLTKTKKENSRPLNSPDEAVAGELQTGVGEDSLRPGEEEVKGGKTHQPGFFLPPFRK